MLCCCRTNISTLLPASHPNNYTALYQVQLTRLEIELLPAFVSAGLAYDPAARCIFE
jgi:hypothetical protein